jgi:predicted kinase
VGWSSRKKWLLLMKGPPGSGKSTVARALGARLAWPVIDKDDARDFLADDQAGLSYRIMLAVARTQLRQGLSVIADSPLGYGKFYGAAMEAADETGAAVAVVECECSDRELWRSRIEGRASGNLAAHHTVTWKQVDDFLSRTAADPPEIRVPLLAVDTAQRLDVCVDQAVSWLSDVDEANGNPSLRA